MTEFTMGVIAGALCGILAILAGFAADPSWNAAQIEKCQKNAEWCAVEKPRLYKVLRIQKDLENDI